MFRRNKPKLDSGCIVMQTSILMATTGVELEKRAFKQFVKSLPRRERRYFVARDNLVLNALTVLVFPTEGSEKDIGGRAKFIDWMQYRDSDAFVVGQRWQYTEISYGQFGVSVNVHRTNCTNASGTESGLRLVTSN